MNLIRSVKFFLLFGVLLVTVPALSHDPKEQAEDVRGFDDQAMDRFARHPDFAYMNSTLRPPNIFQRILWFISEFLWRMVSRRENLLLTLFIVVMAVIAIYFLVRMRFRGAIDPTSHTNITGESAAVLDVRVDYQARMQEALESKEYRMAIRYLYLHSLVLLAIKERVRLAEWKTPYDYQLELKGDAVGHYEQLSLLFEYVWYGDAEVKRADFDKGRNYFERLEEAVE